MMDPYAREAERAVLEGATPAQVDGALEQFGMAMGILAVFDMAGVDVAALTRRESTDPTYFRCSTILHQQGWLGQKTGRGFYRYEGRQRQPHPEAEALFRQEAQRLGVEQRAPQAQEIQQRCLFEMVNEAALILQEGIAQRPSDIDVVYTAGYGFPRHRGGPLFWADSVGLPKVLQGIESFAQRFGTLNWTPAPLLCELARSGRTFGQWSREA
jgi:3-hydroxyacyl-CoA dehydrogenase